MSTFQRIFETVLTHAASAADFITDVRAPLDTDGAHIATDTWDKRARELLEQLRKPAASVKDLPPVLDAIRNANSVGIDDRLLLLEDVLVLMSRLSSDSKISAKLQQEVISLLYNDLPHPPRDYLAPYDNSVQARSTWPATKDNLPPTYAFRSADGSNYNPLIPSLGKAGSPYALSVPPVHIVPKHELPDPGLVFDQVLRRKEFIPHPGGISSLFFAFADLVIHSIFDTDHHDPRFNKTSSYLDLSILYGNCENDVDQVRRKDGTGRLWDDVFSDARLLLMPPASCALLVLLNRNHNYIAEKLLDINENGTYGPPDSMTDEDKRIQDDDIFHRTRLINCGFFMNIILGDYVGAILGLVTDGSSWRLEPLMDMRASDHSVSPRGEGNVVSAEFNLLYRWHATLSEQDAAWTEKEFKGFFGDKDLGKVTIQDFIQTAHRALIPNPDLRKRTFAGLQRQPNGRFKDDDLARIIQDATEWRAAAYSSGCPEALRVIEILGIEQSRSWNTCTLNEFRKFLQLKPYGSFSEWNPDSSIHTAAEALYGHIDNLELHVGLQAEECKKPGPGAGLCPGYTISRAILADAVSLTRGDPYLTNQFNTRNCTQWGYDDCQYDKLDGSYGGLLTKLLFRTLPDNYPAGSAYAHFPFLVPEYIKEKNGNRHKYNWERPPVAPSPPVTIKSYTTSKQVLGDKSFISTSDARLFNIASQKLKTLKQESFTDGRHIVENLIDSAHTNNLREETQDLIRDKSFKNYDGSKTVDILRDVINLAPVHWISNEIFGLPLKTHSNRTGSIYERTAYDEFAALARYVYSNGDPVDDWHLRLDAEAAFSKLFDHAKRRFDEAKNKYSPPALLQLGLDHVAVQNPKPSLHFAELVMDKFTNHKQQATEDELAAYTVAAVIPTAAHFSHAVAQVVDFYLDDDKKKERAEIVDLAASISTNKDNTKKIMAYVREALRLRPPVSAVYRTAAADIPVSGFETIENCERVLVDLVDSNLDVSVFGSNPSVAVYDRTTPGLLWNNQGLLSPSFFESTVPILVGTILAKKNIRRTRGNPGTLPRFTEKWHGIETQLYFDGKGKITPFAPSLKVDFDD